MITKRYTYGKFIRKEARMATYKKTQIVNIDPVIRVYNRKEPNVYSQNYANPPIPEGYKYVCGKWDNGFVIERWSDGSQFVWVPVSILDANGTLDGKFFNEKLGRRNYCNNAFSRADFHEILTEDFVRQLESVKKYGGFYISRYSISKNQQTGEPQSRKGEEPWTNIKFKEAKSVAKGFEKKDTITSHLTFGAEYDSVLEWFIKSKKKTYREIAKNSTNWGNYWNSKNSTKSIWKTGSCEEGCVNNIYDMAGNIEEWTQERNDSSFCIIRGGSYRNKGKHYPTASRVFDYPNNSSSTIGFRIVLCIQ